MTKEETIEGLRGALDIFEKSLLYSYSSREFSETFYDSLIDLVIDDDGYVEAKTEDNILVLVNMAKKYLESVMVFDN